MSSCFYNANGMMLGADFHEYITFIPPAVLVPVGIPAAHFVTADFIDSCESPEARLGDVTSDGFSMIQGGFKLTWILPHVPITVAPPHVLEALNFTMILWLSGSTAILAVATVTGVGKPLACCVHAAGGANLNCGDPIDQPLNLVANNSTVLTEPTAADFARAVLDIAVSGIISVTVGGIFKKWMGNPLTKPFLFPFRKKAEDFVKNAFEWIAEKVKGPIKNPTKAKATLRSLGVTHV